MSARGARRPRVAAGADTGENPSPTGGDISCGSPGGAPAEDNRLQQAVAGQAVGAVDTGAGRLAAGEQTGYGGRAHQVTADTADHVVGCRSDRDKVGGDVHPQPQAGGVDLGEAAANPIRAQVTDVEEDVVGVVTLHLRPDGAGDHVAGRQLGLRVALHHEAPAAGVDQDAAFAAHRLADQEAGRPLFPERRGVELEELHVGELGACLVGQGRGAAVGGGRVGGVAEEGSATARGEDYSAAAVLPQLTARLGHDAHADAVLDQQLPDDVALAGLDAGVAEGMVQAALDLGPGGVAAGVDDPGLRVRGLPTQSQPPPLAIKTDAQRHQLPNPAGPLLHQHPHRLGVAEAPADLHGVGHVLLGRVARAHRRGYPALGVDRVALPHRGLGQQQDRPRSRRVEGGEGAGDPAADDDEVSAGASCRGKSHSGRGDQAPVTRADLDDGGLVARDL